MFTKNMREVQMIVYVNYVCYDSTSSTWVSVEYVFLSIFLEFSEKQTNLFVVYIYSLKNKVITKMYCYEDLLS